MRNRKNINISQYIIPNLMFFMIAIAYADNPPTNEQFVVKTVASEIEVLMDSLQIEKSDIFVEPQDGLTALIIDGFKTGAMNYGMKVVNNKENNDDDLYTVAISLSAFNFKYKNGKSRGFFRKPYIKRNLTGQMLININGNGFGYLGYREFVVSDEVEPSAVNYISSLRYNQLSPEPPGGGVKKYLEPLAVTATVGGLIYLFFINR